jgi:hypothetical protein
MKNTLIRAFVVALALSGAAATVRTSNAHTVVAGGPTGFPIPLCPPNDPNACGIQ